MKKIVYSLILVSICLCACNNAERIENGINLSDNIGIGNLKYDSTCIIIENIISPELTDSTILGLFYIEEVSDKYIYLSDLEHIYAFSNNGICKNLIFNKGNGPTQYLNLTSIIIDEDNSIIQVFDDYLKKILSYDIAGNYINSMNTDSLNTLTRMKNGNYIAYNNFSDDCVYDLCVYDKDWRFLYGRTKNCKEELKTTIYRVVKDFIHSNDCVYIYENDSILKISEDNNITPNFFLIKKNLKIPNEILYDISRKKERKNYIWGETLCFSSNICFIKYYYNNKIFYDIWNIDKSSLLFRNIVETDNDAQGFPICINGTIVHTWPSYCKDDSFYAIVDEIGTEVLNNKKEINPCIIKFKFND